MAQKDKVGSLYVEIRAQIQKLSKDLSDAQSQVERSVSKMQQTVDRGINISLFAGKAAAASAALFGLKKAFDSVVYGMANTGEQIFKQEKAFENLANASGASARAIVADLRSISKGMIAEADIIRSAGTAMMLGIPFDRISDMMRVAVATSRMTGQSVTDAFNDITIGVARQSKMILDNLGIIVDVDRANQEYARSLGKTASALDEVERRTAFLNAVMKAGEDIINRIGSAQGELEGANKAIVAHKNLWDEINKSVAVFLNDTLSKYAPMLQGLADKLKEMRDRAKDEERRREENLIERSRRLESVGRVPRGTTAAMALEYQKRWVGRSEAEMAGEAAIAAWRKPDWLAAWREREGQYPELVKSELDRMRAEQEAHRKAIANEAEKIQREQEHLLNEIMKGIEEFERAKAYSGEGSNYERLEALLRGGGELARMEAERIKNVQRELDEAFEAENRRISENAKAWAEANREIIEAEKRKQEILKDTANIMSQNFSNAFADIIMGTRNVEAAFKSMINSIIAGMVRLATQQGFENLFGSLMRGLPGLLGLGGAGLAINKPGYFASVQPFHGGGIVGYTGGALRSVPMSAFAFAPRFHDGLYPGEFPAILQRGETVLPRGVSAGNVINYYYISAIDTQSFIDAARRSGAIPLLAAEDISRNGPLRAAILSRAR